MGLNKTLLATALAAVAAHNFEPKAKTMNKNEVAPTAPVAQIDPYTADELNDIEAIAVAAPKCWYGTYQIVDGISNEKAVALIEACSPDSIVTLVGMARASLVAGQQVGQQAGDAAGDSVHQERMKLTAEDLADPATVIATLRARLASAQMDAERYRFLRDNCNNAFDASENVQMVVLRRRATEIPKRWTDAPDAPFRIAIRAAIDEAVDEAAAARAQHTNTTATGE